MGALARVHVVGACLQVVGACCARVCCVRACAGVRACARARVLAFERAYMCLRAHARRGGFVCARTRTRVRLIACGFGCKGVLGAVANAHARRDKVRVAVTHVAVTQSP